MERLNRTFSERWFHAHITGHEAERLLMEKGQDGSFLGRPSSIKGSYTLSVRRGDEVTHIKIQNSGDLYDLCGGETFASLLELVQYYMENQALLKEKNGAPVRLKYPLVSVDPTIERWFHGCLKGREAERLLLEKGKNSSFLVRGSQSNPGDFVISVRSEDRVSHVKIRCQDGKYDVGGGEKFVSLAELVEHYRKSPMVDTAGHVVHIKHALNTSRMTASSLESRIKQLQAGDELNQKSNSTTNDGFWGEFHQLQQAEFTGAQFAREVGNKPENRTKNRYKNILPYDCTRVILTDGKEELGSEYINANYITWTDDDQLIEQNRKYIATQGPLVSTMADFYRMIWQEKTRVLINLARITERGKVQINVYWPTAEDNNKKVFAFNQPNSDGSTTFVCSYSVTLLKETEDHICNRRDLLLCKEDINGKTLGEPRKIYLFHYTIWPDYNVPEDPSSMIRLLERINTLLDSLPNPGPILVHCSAGIGRTGTLIVIDMIINQIKTYGFDCDIDILKTILMVRGQRSGLVQTQSQYQFVYLAVQKYMEMVKQSQLQAVSDNEVAEYTNIKSVSAASPGSRLSK